MITTENLQLPVIPIDDAPVAPAGSLEYNPVDKNVYVGASTQLIVTTGSTGSAFSSQQWGIMFMYQIY